MGFGGLIVPLTTVGGRCWTWPECNYRAIAHSGQCGRLDDDRRDYRVPDRSACSTATDVAQR